MAEKNEIVLVILILLAFLWRFARTRRLYLTSLAVQLSRSDPVPFHPSDLREFIDQAILGHRSLPSSSFFVRGAVFMLVAFCLLPFKHYEPTIFWLVITLISLYAPFCAAHGLVLRKKIAATRG